MLPWLESEVIGGNSTVSRDSVRVGEIKAVSRDSTSVPWAAAPLTLVNGGSKHWSPLQS